MPEQLAAPAETATDVEAPQGESVESDISQVSEYGADVDQTQIPAPEDGQVEGQEATGEEPEVEAQETETVEGDEKVAGAGEQVSRQTPAFEPWLLDRAEQVGLTAEDVQRFETSEGLRETVRALSRQSTQKPPEQPEAPAPEPTIEDYKVGKPFSAEVLGEEVAGPLNEQRDRYAEQAFKQDRAHRQEMNDIKTAMGGMIAQSRAMQGQREVDVVDSWVQRTPDVQRLLGKGPTSSLKAGSTQRNDREAIKVKAKIFGNAYAQAGERKTDDELCAEAGAVVLNERMKRAARADVTDKLVSRKGQAVGKPTQMPNKAGTPEERADAIWEEGEKRLAAERGTSDTF